METAAGLGPELFIEELMLLTSQTLSKMEVDERYEVVRELGCGTYGNVQLVRHRLRGTLMALKLMQKGKTQRRSFLREYSVSLYLSAHPFITTAFGIAFESRQYYGFVQEYAPEGDLFSLIEPQVGIPELAAKRCALQLALALEHLHGLRLVHRDVKPENVLLFDRECRRVALSDLGLVRRAGLRVRPCPPSPAVPYLAPELCGGGDGGAGGEGGAGGGRGLALDPAEDAWALGVLLYSVLTGNFPWSRASPEDPLFRAFARWQGPPAPPSSPGPPRPPPQWRAFTPTAGRMLRALLALEAPGRAPVTDVMRHLKAPWLLAAPGRPGPARKAPPHNTDCASRVLREPSGTLGPKLL